MLTDTYVRLNVSLLYNIVLKRIWPTNDIFLNNN